MFCRDPRKPIAIFKGDDTDFEGNRKLYIDIESLGDLNVKEIIFSFLGVRKSFDTLPTNQRLEISFDREETDKFPLGTSFATLTAIDFNNKSRTLDNRIAILVTNNVNLAYCGDDDKLVSIKIGTINADIVPPNEEAQTGEAADARATYEALKAKADKSELSAEVERAKGAEAALDERVTELEENGGGASVTVDDTLTQDGENPVKSKGIWSAIWGAIAAPAASVYAWVMTELGKKQDKLKEGDNITIAEDGTISAAGIGADDVVAAIEGKEIKPSSVVMRNENSTIAMNDALPFCFEKFVYTVFKKVNIDVSQSNLGINLESSEEDYHEGNARYGCEGFNVGRQNGANNTFHSFDLSVKSGKVTYVGSDAPITIENTIANMVNAMPRYPFVGKSVIWQEEFYEGRISVTPYVINSFEIGNYPSAECIITIEDGDEMCRDCVLVLKIPKGITMPKLVFPTNFHPRTDAETDFACVAGVRNVYWITEHAPNEFCVAGWQETTGGNAQ